MSSCTVKAAAMLALLVALIIAVPAVFGRVVLRSGVALDTPVEAVSPDGVRTGGGAGRTIAWDTVRDVEGVFAPDAELYLPLADELWRARTRLARGDVRLAAPSFASLYAEYPDAGGPTGLHIREGHLRCLLIAGETRRAVGPWLGVLELRLGGVRPAAGLASALVFDEELNLCPQLPPIFVADSVASSVVDTSTERWAVSPGESASEASEPAVFAGLYRLAARGPLVTEGLPDIDLAPTDEDTAGVAFVRALIRAQHGAQPAGRAAARESLVGVIERRPGTYLEAWCRAAIGRSLIAETDRSERFRGVLQLLHVPARFMRAHPYLSGVCLADAARTLDELGEAQAAVSVRAELERALPGHPAAVTASTGAAGVMMPNRPESRAVSR